MKSKRLRVVFLFTYYAKGQGIERTTENKGFRISTHLAIFKNETKPLDTWLECLSDLEQINAAEFRLLLYLRRWAEIGKRGFGESKPNVSATIPVPAPELEGNGHGPRDGRRVSCTSAPICKIQPGGIYRDPQSTVTASKGWSERRRPREQSLSAEKQILESFCHWFGL
ncbi:Transmembrane Protein 68 [Manis pentadactyla]|nr:Transmembrane Protein 68 [Manis pentadactyla]